MNFETQDPSSSPANETNAPLAESAGVTFSSMVQEAPDKPASAQEATTSAPGHLPGEGTGPLEPRVAGAPGSSGLPSPVIAGEPGTAQRRKRLRLDWRLLTVLALAAVAIPVWRAATTHAKAQRPAVTPALPVVAVARVQRRDLYNEVTYLAEFRPFVEVSLHAKVSGYVKEINVDFGDRVKAGQLLAKLEVPELQDELDQALASEKRAEADYHVAHIAYQRLLAVDKQNPNLVVQQDLDAAEGKDHTTEAAIASAKAEVEKYQTLVSYTRITAPFDGVVTHRFADPGTLIQSGTSSDTQSMPLVCVSDNYHLRLDFPVDLPYVKDVHEGDTVAVRVDSLGRTFTGKITRCTHKIDADTRKMTTEIEVPNPDLELVPGMYATAIQKVDKRPAALSIPIEAVSSEQDPTVYMVNDHQEVEERPITLGLITADRFEVKAGLKEGDLVMIGSRAEVKPGEKVATKVIGSLAED